MKQTTESTGFGRVAVLYGGWSPEREVSLESGRRVLEALQRRGVDATGIDADPRTVLGLAEAGYERVFIVLHGTGGEDGTVQAALELQGLPYTGSGVAASALSMDKARSKRIWQACGLPTPEFAIVRNAAEAAEAVERLGLPVFVKPNNQGSSVGMSRVDAPQALGAAVEAARAHAAELIVERAIVGQEMTCAVLGGEALPLVRIRTSGWYDYHAKYQSDQTGYDCPAPVDEATAARWQRLCVQAFEALGCSGWGRIDFIADADGTPWLLEANTVPGMTSHSLVPMAARAAGIGFDELCLRILQGTGRKA